MQNEQYFETNASIDAKREEKFREIIKTLSGKHQKYHWEFVLAPEKKNKPSKTIVCKLKRLDGHDRWIDEIFIHLHKPTVTFKVKFRAEFDNQKQLWPFKIRAKLWLTMTFVGLNAFAEEGLNKLVENYYHQGPSALIDMIDVKKAPASVS